MICFACGANGVFFTDRVINSNEHRMSGYNNRHENENDYYITHYNVGQHVQ